MNKIHKTRQTWQTHFGAPILAILIMLFSSGKANAQCPTITFNNTVATNSLVATAYSLNASATTTSGTLSYTVSPTLPVGLALNATTGQITGTPTTATASASYIVTARTSTTCSATQSYTFAVLAPCPTITPNNTVTTNGTVGVAYTLNASATATFGTLSYTVSPVLPAGLALNATTGQITGTPTTVTASASYIVTARTSTTCGFAQSYTFAVVSPVSPCPTITFNNAIAPIGTVGTVYTLNASATTTSGTLGYTVSPALPAGLVLDATTGQVTGVPTTSLSASYVVTASTSTTCSATQSYFISIVPACPTITFNNTGTANGTVGAAYFLNVNATATAGTLGYTVSPALPAGLILDATTGQITGVPTVATLSTGYLVTARTSSTCSNARNYFILIVPASASCPTITFANTIATNGTVGTAYTLNASATATSGTLGYTVLPALPAGLVLDATTGQITGTPTVASLSVDYVVTARTSSTCSLDKIYNITINAGTQNPTTAIDNALANLVKVSPNPSKGDFSVDFGKINMTKSSVRVHDAQGKVIFTSENNTNLMVISLEKFANGIYLMEVATSKGRILKRLVKN